MRGSGREGERVGIDRVHPDAGTCIGRDRRVDNQGSAVGQELPMKGDVLLLENEEQVGTARPDQGAVEPAHLQVGDDHPAPLCHPVRFRGEHRESAGDRRLGQEAGEEQDPLPSDAGQDDLPAHGGRLPDVGAHERFSPADSCRIAPTGQT
jgi:hypothetical protein